jgi:RNA polymerase sigma factor (sigma-70 family)
MRSDLIKETGPMAGGSADTDLTNQLNTLFRVGVIGDLSDGQLLQRYLTAPDGAFQAAFTALVGRHGPMVLRVCRQVLGDSHDAQDAFQATFLVLIRKAGSVRKVDSLASWLHRVAFRCAVRTRADASRRRVHERRGVAMRATGAECEGVRAESWSELHEEVARLPERYREPVVLCYLEGLTTEAAALRLGCPRGTVLSRLSRARERLRARLARRGLDSVPAMVQIIVDAPAPVPDSLAVATTALAALDAVRLSAGGPPVAGIALTSVLTVSAGVLNTMTIAKLKTAAVALLTVAQ